MRAVSDQDFLVVTDDVAKPFTRTEAVIAAAGFNQCIEETVAYIPRSETVDDQLDVHSIICGSHQRVTHLTASGIIAKHIEKHLDRFFSAGDEPQYCAQPILRRMNHMQIVARNVKVRSGKVGPA